MIEYQFKVGVSLSLGETPDTDENLHALIESVMGHVEIKYAAYCNDPNWTGAVRRRIEASPVNINTVHAPFSREVDISRLDEQGRGFAIQEISKAISMAERLGAGIVVLHGSSEPIVPAERSRRIDRSKESLNILGKRAGAAGVRLALELLPRTCLGNTADELQALLADVPVGQAGFCLDTNHLADASQLLSTVRQLGERIITLHISDYDGVDERHWMPFRGIVNWGAFANALDEIEYTGAFIYETMPEGNTMAERLATIQANFQHILTSAADANRLQKDR